METCIAVTPFVYIATLGCAKNEVDSATMARNLREAGYGITDEVEKAAAIIINTCSFIQSATEESLEAIFEAAGLDAVASGEVPLIVAGCMPARYGEELSAELTEATAFVPCSREDDIVTVVEKLVGKPCPSFNSTLQQTDTSAHPVYSYVKISDGCNRFCSYCAIPFIRGRYHSFPYETIHGDVVREVASGAREIVLIAQDTGAWGADLGEGHDLAWLMDALAGDFPETWFRVMYLQPEGITDRLLSVMAAHDNICSYLDIPLQHVSEPLLRAMNRSGNADAFRALVKRIEHALPDVTLRTTLIAGFPGETEEEFESLLDFVSEGLFHYVGVFAYSREEGTRAYDLPGQIDEDEKAYRAQALRDAADVVSGSRIAERCGERFSVLVEGFEEDGQRFGRTQGQAPEVDGVTFVPFGDVGEMVSVRIVDTLLYEMEGE